MRVLVVVADDLRQRLSRILRRVERAGHRERPLLQQQRGRQDRRDRRVPLALPVEVRHRQRGMLELHQTRRGLRGLGPALAAAAVPRLVVRGGQPALAGGWWRGFERCPRRRYAVEEPRVPPSPRLGRHAAAPGEWHSNASSGSILFHSQIVYSNGRKHRLSSLVYSFPPHVGIKLEPIL